MPSSVTQPLYDGETMTFPEFAARTARIVGPWVAYEREFPVDAPLPDEFLPDTERDTKRLHEAALELAKVALWTEEEADTEAHTHNLTILKYHLQTVRSSREHVRAYNYMSAQVGAWAAPTEEHESMRIAMQSQLDDTFDYAVRHVHDQPPTKITGQEYREMRLRGLAREIQLREETVDVSSAQLEQSSEFARQFKESLEDWEEVPVPRRVLP